MSHTLDLSAPARWRWPSAGRALMGVLNVTPDSFYEGGRRGGGREGANLMSATSAGVQPGAQWAPRRRHTHTRPLRTATAVGLTRCWRCQCAHTARPHAGR